MHYLFMQPIVSFFSLEGSSKVKDFIPGEVWIYPWYFWLRTPVFGFSGEENLEKEKIIKVLCVNVYFQSLPITR